MSAAMALPTDAKRAIAAFHYSGDVTADAAVWWDQGCSSTHSDHSLDASSKLKGGGLDP